MEKYEIACLYHANDETDAVETFEDIQSELSAFGISCEKLKGRKLQIGNTVITFLSFDSSAKKKYDSVYTSDKLRKNHHTYLTSISAKLSYHRIPFQHLIDMVLEIKEHAITKELIEV